MAFQKILIDVITTFGKIKSCSYVEVTTTER